MYNRSEDHNPNIDRWHEEERPYYDFEKIIGKARIKSTKKNIKISYKGDTITLSKKKLSIFFVKAATMIVALIIACVFLFKVGDAAIDQVTYLMDVVAVRKEECEEVEQLLISNNLNTAPGEDGNWCNDYSNLEELSKGDIYGFYHYCGYDETEKVLKELGYPSWQNFLIREGYYDAGGAPSFEAWENYAEYELVTEQREALENGKQY